MHLLTIHFGRPVAHVCDRTYGLVVLAKESRRCLAPELRAYEGVASAISTEFKFRLTLLLRIMLHSADISVAVLSKAS